MAVKQLQSYPREESDASEKASAVYSRVQARKLIVTVQTCSRCGRTFDFDRRRRCCPKCRGTLRGRAVVLEIY
jgi:predicted Zn-ribbon and HTH transcriptional regulator